MYSSIYIIINNKWLWSIVHGTIGKCTGPGQPEQWQVNARKDCQVTVQPHRKNLVNTTKVNYVTVAFKVSVPIAAPYNKVHTCSQPWPNSEGMFLKLFKANKPVSRITNQRILRKNTRKRLFLWCKDENRTHHEVGDLKLYRDTMPLSMWNVYWPLDDVQKLSYSNLIVTEYTKLS